MVKVYGERERSITDRTRSTIRLEGDDIVVEFANTRSQKVFVGRQSEKYVFSSIVLLRSDVDAVGEERLLPLIWAKNRETNVVGFSIDKKRRLVGRIEQLVESLDPEELEFYLLTLARECDVFEHSLGGVDRY